MKRSAIATCAVLVAVAFVVWTSSSCAPRVVAWPISESHSQMTASDYDEAETSFAGGLAPLPYELAATACQELLDKRNRVRAFKLGLIGLSGGSGFTTLMPKDATADERKVWDYTLGGLTLASATAATVLGAYEITLSAEFESECATKPAPVMVPMEPVEHQISDENETDGGVS